MHTRADLENPASGFVGLLDAGHAVDDALGWEVGTLDELHQIGNRAVAVIDIMVDGGDDFAQVVRRKVGGHADGDTRDAIHQKVGDGAGKHGGFLEGVVKVVGPLDGLFLDVLEHLIGNALQTALGVTHGGGAVAVHGSKVSLALDEGMPHRESLDETDEGFVNGLIAVGVVLSEHFPDHRGCLFEGPVVVHAEFVESEKNAAVNRLEAVAHIRKGTRHDHAHGVIEVRDFHLIFDKTVDDFFGHRNTSPLGSGSC